MSQTIRHSMALLLMVLGIHVPDLVRWRAAGGAGTRGTSQNVILVVADGLRWQEVFRGADSLIVWGRDAGGDGTARSAYWRSSTRERREALMPFVWRTIAREGQLIGNRDRGSAAVVTNPMKFSYPGYNELLVGYPDPRIDRNDFGPNPNVTVFEWLGGQPSYRGSVAATGTWTVFADIFNARRSRLPVTTTESDALTHAVALRHLQRDAPRALFVGYGETDDRAHRGGYEATLDAAHAVDRYLSELWATVQRHPRYRGRTTLIVVADHGRGRTSRDWTDHGQEIPGSDETWMAMIGPGIPAAGERRGGPRVTLAQVAATVAHAVGADYPRSVPRAAPPIATTLHR